MRNPLQCTTQSAQSTDPETPATKDRLLSVKDCAELLSCHPATIWRMVKAEQFPNPLRLGHLTRWSETDVQLLLARVRADRTSE